MAAHHGEKPMLVSLRLSAALSLLNLSSNFANSSNATSSSGSSTCGQEIKREGQIVSATYRWGTRTHLLDALDFGDVMTKEILDTVLCE